MTFAEYVTGHRAEADHEPLTTHEIAARDAGYRLFNHLRAAWGLTYHDDRSYMLPKWADDAKGIRVKRYAGHYLAGEGCSIVIDAWRRQQGALTNTWITVAAVHFEDGVVTASDHVPDDLVAAAEAALRGERQLPPVTYFADAEREAQYAAHLAEVAAIRAARAAAEPYLTASMAGLLTECRWAVRAAETVGPWYNPTKTLEEYRATGARTAIERCAELRARIAHVREREDAAARAEELDALEQWLDKLEPRAAAVLAELA